VLGGYVMGQSMNLLFAQFEKAAVVLAILIFRTWHQTASAIGLKV
jgi:hypothetical protein